MKMMIYRGVRNEKAEWSGVYSGKTRIQNRITLKETIKRLKDRRFRTISAIENSLE